MVRSVGANWTTVVSIGEADQVIPAGPWRSAGGLVKVRFTGEVRNRTASFNLAGGVQFANDELNPDATATLVGAFIAANGNLLPTGGWTQLGAAADGKQLARPVFVVKNAAGAGATLHIARVQGRWDMVED